MDDTNPRYEALIELLRTADIVWSGSRMLFERWDLGPSQFNVLNLLRYSPEGLSQTELSRELIMHRSNLTGLVDRLEKRGLVARKEVAGDRRAYRVVLTAAGVGLMEQILPDYYRGAHEVWGGASAKNIRDLTKTLKLVSQNAQQIAARLSRPKEEPEHEHDDRV